ncbi:hypothetical protein CK203_019190 [Vitis vinifera]|uniref:Uncharacterized protein n=1 Tax=Vitis vinifera TaxID=29760 RepID=A0A438J7N8_VITVI|nr:hypothetical protein CK203_019190 [Vitis vinifera]
MGRMEIKIQFCPTIWESDSGERRGALQGRVEERSGERIGQGSFRCASSLAPVRVVARFRCASGRASGRFGVSFRVLSRRAQVSELARNASGARRCKLQGRVEARSGERIGQETLQVCVEPRSSARRGALQVTVGARFRSLRGALQGRVEGRSGERIGQGSFRCASSHAPVRVEPRSSARRGALQERFRYASSLAPVRVAARFRVVLRSAQVSELAKEASGARRGALQVGVGARFRSLRGKLQGRVEARSGERIGFRCASSLAPVRVEARFRCASRRASGARRGALRVVSRRASGSCQGALQSEAATRKGYASGFENG